MISKTQVNRLGMLTALLAFSFLALGFRLVDLQVMRHHEYKSEVNNRVEHSFFIEPRRGEIRDVSGNTLVYSEFVKTVVANPEYIKTHWYEMAALIAEDLGYEVEVLAEKLKPRTNSNGSKLRYVMLKNKVTENQWELIAAKVKACRFSYGEKKVLKKNYIDLKNLQTKAIYCDSRRDTQLRIHPHNNFASQLLGYGGVDQSPSKNDRKETFKGKSGIEQRMNKVLAGVPGWGRKFYAKSSLELTHSREVFKNVQNGRHVVLTIDMGVQQIVEDALREAMKEHQPLTASAIVIRPRTGDVLAMASMPDFNPNSLGDSPVGTWKNRIIGDFYEPGSTFKVIVLAAALNEGVIRISDSVFCENGCYMYAGRA
ncbi:MAG TPA: hypothetical protein EYG38_11520, partial [Verrucomicrobia bacterium]|nr:hypothetical protein [Verrucomicrobiota bacterium]